MMTIVRYENILSKNGWHLFSNTFLIDMLNGKIDLNSLR